MNGRLRPVCQLVKMHVIQGIILVVVIEDGGIVVRHRVMAARSPGRRRRHRWVLVVGGSGGGIGCVGVGRNIRDGISSTFLVDGELLGSVRLRGSSRDGRAEDGRRGIEERSGEKIQEIQNNI